LLPVDAEFKGYEEVVVQDIKLTTDNVLFRKQILSLRGKNLLSGTTRWLRGEFGPGIKALVISLYYGNMTQSKFLEFLGDIGISMSAGYLSNLLIKTTRTFILRKVKSMKRDLLVVLGSTLTKQLPVLLGLTTQLIVCNLYTVYFTTEKKDRLTVLKVTKRARTPVSSQSTHVWPPGDFPNSQKIQKSLKLLPQETEFSDLDFNTLLDNHLPKLGSQQRTRVMDAAAIAFTTIKPIVVQALICDDAPQFKLLTLSWLCVGYMKGDTTKVESCGGLSSKAFR